MEEVVALEQPLLKYQQPEANAVPKQPQILPRHFALAGAGQLGDFFDVAELPHAPDAEQHEPMAFARVSVHEHATEQLETGLNQDDGHVIAQ